MPPPYYGFAAKTLQSWAWNRAPYWGSLSDLSDGNPYSYAYWYWDPWWQPDSYQYPFRGTFTVDSPGATQVQVYFGYPDWQWGWPTQGWKLYSGGSPTDVSGATLLLDMPPGNYWGANTYNLPAHDPSTTYTVEFYSLQWDWELYFCSFVLGGAGAPVNFALLPDDTVTQGNWVGVYGKEGYWISQSTQALPPGVSVTIDNGRADHTWSWPANGDARAPWNDLTMTNRIAGTWYTGGPSYDINFNLGGQMFDIGLYLLDWDGGNVRSQRHDFMKGGAAFEQVSYSSYSSPPRWNRFRTNENITVRVTNLTGGWNGVLSAMTFDKAVAGVRHFFRPLSPFGEIL